MADSQIKAWTIGELIQSNAMITVRKNGRSNPVELVKLKFSKHQNEAGLYLVVDTKVHGNGNVWTQKAHLLAPTVGAVKGMMAKNAIPIMHKGDKLWLNPFTMDTPIRIKCTCPDYQHTTEWRNAEAKSLAGKKRTYTSKGSGVSRDAGRPGLCKHCLAMIDKLDDLGVLSK